MSLHQATSESIGFTWSSLLNAFEDTLMISFFVLVMLMLIEFITVQTRGRWSQPLRSSGWLQIIVAMVLGIIPGCLGAFTAVSLYIHRIFNFAALTTTMIATTGDEAFVMFSMMPGDALKINGLLIALSVLVGAILYLLLRNKNYVILKENLLDKHHRVPECKGFEPKSILPQLKNISFTRALLMTFSILFLFFLVFGIGHGNDTDHNHAGWGWEKITLLVVTIIGLFIVTTVPDHFLHEHLWKHTILKHMPRIFIWTFVAFLFIELVLGQFDLVEWLQANTIIVLAVALLLGVIPQSGPHIIFITMFANGVLPFSILLANSVVQDGHGAMPLLAESPRSFIILKGIKLLIGFIIGIVGLLAGF
jgi:hypothetical protein